MSGHAARQLHSQLPIHSPSLPLRPPPCSSAGGVRGGQAARQLPGGGDQARRLRLPAQEAERRAGAVRARVRVPGAAAGCALGRLCVGGNGQRVGAGVLQARGEQGSALRGAVLAVSRFGQPASPPPAPPAPPLTLNPPRPPSTLALAHPWYCRAADHPTKFEFENGIVGNAIPPNYIPSCEKVGGWPPLQVALRGVALSPLHCCCR